MSKDIWEEKLKKNKNQNVKFTTLSGLPVKPLYTPDDIKDFDYQNDLNSPREFPFTRGVYSNMYRGKLWTMRQFAGFGTAQETNQRYKYLLKHGQTGLSSEVGDSPMHLNIHLIQGLLHPLHGSGRFLYHVGPLPLQGA